MENNLYAQEKKKKVAFITLGCKVNQYDSDAMRSLFLQQGYEPAQGEEEADVYVINTCSVTSTGDKKSRQMIRRMRRNHPEAIIAVAGCYAQVSPEEIAALGDADVIIGTQNRSHIVEYVESARKGGSVNRVSDIMACRDFENLTVNAEGEVKTRAFIKVQEGCNNFCTFCIIPYARGGLKSRKPEDALREAARLVVEGYREIVLTGIHLGNYGVDLRNGTTLSSLLEKLLSIPGLSRIRLGSIESVELSDELVRLVREEPRICPHLHLPLQSGSDAVLRGMNRHYRLEAYRRLIGRLREDIPDLALTTDLIVGFPGETEDYFQETLQTLEDIQFAGIHVFPYSRRSGTPAASYPDQVPEAVKKERVRRVQELERPISRGYRARFLGRIVRVLAEEEKGGVFEGLSDEYVRVVLRGHSIRRGGLYSVMADSLTEEGLLGTVIKEEI